MSNDTFDEKLKSLQMPTIGQSYHKAALKRALTSSSHWDKNITIYRRKAYYMPKIKFLISGASLAVIALAFVAIGLQQPKVEASRLQQSYKTVSSLSAVQQTELKEKLSVDPKLILESAKKADGLQELTYDQLIKQYPNIVYNMIKPGSDSKSEESKGSASHTTGVAPSFKKATYFVYNEQQALTVIGVDDNNLPILYTNIVSAQPTTTSSN